MHTKSPMNVRKIKLKVLVDKEIWYAWNFLSFFDSFQDIVVKASLCTDFNNSKSVKSAQQHQNSCAAEISRNYAIKDSWLKTSISTNINFYIRDYSNSVGHLS